MIWKKCVVAGAVKAKAKDFHNVIHAPMLDIELDHVCPPYLNILLGLVVKHHKCLEEEVLGFDRIIEQEKAKLSGEKRALWQIWMELEGSISIARGENILRDMRHFKQWVNRQKRSQTLGETSGKDKNSTPQTEKGQEWAHPPQSDAAEPLSSDNIGL